MQFQMLICRHKTPLGADFFFLFEAAEMLGMLSNCAHLMKCLFSTGLFE